MDKQLVVLSESGNLSAFQSGSGPFDVMRIIDAKAGLQGQKFIFSRDWQCVLEQAYGVALPAYVLYDLREIPSVDKVNSLAEAAGRLICRIRQESTEPFFVPVSDDGSLGIIFQPSGREGDKIGVTFEPFGDVEIHYTTEGKMLLNIFSADGMLVPKGNLQFDAEELMAKNDNSQEWQS